MLDPELRGEVEHEEMCGRTEDVGGGELSQD